MTLVARLRRIELSPFQWTMAGVFGVFLALNVVLAFGYLGDIERRDDRLRQAAIAESAIAAMRRTADIDSLRQELSDTEAKVASNPASFPKDIDSVSLIGLVTNAARLAGIDLSRTEAGTQSLEKLGANEYRAFRYTVAARGQLAQIAQFLNKLETSGFNTVVISGQTFNAQTTTWTVSIELTAFAQKG